MDNIHEQFMAVALEEALVAAEIKEVPVGAVIVKDGEIIARAHNLRENDFDPTAHAEVLSIRYAAKKLNRWNLSDCDLYVTLEPCVMCSGAIIYSRIRHVYFGAHDLRFGCGGSVLNLLEDNKFNHRAEVTGGVMEQQCIKPIKEFFQQLRQKPKKKFIDGVQQQPEIEST